MSVSTDIPGYSGYAQNFQSQYVTDKDVPACKYEDYNEPPVDPMAGSMYASTYKKSYDANNKDRSEGVMDDSLPRKNFKYIQDHSKQMNTTRQLNEYEQRPTYWTSTYQNQMNGWKNLEMAKQQAAVTNANNIYTTQRTAKQIETMNACGGNSEGKALVAQDVRSTYGKDFGLAGEGPRDRYVAADGVCSFSRRASTNDMFAGTAKGSDGLRLPNYSGHVPASSNNVNLIRNNIKYNVKDGLIQTYSHNLPKYTGHRPQAVTNDRGPRNPESKCELPVGMDGGLMLASMKFS